MEKFKDFILHPLTITALVIILGAAGVFGLFKVFSSSDEGLVGYTEKYWGKADSKVVITEYADFQCPACGNFYSTVEVQLKANYSDKIKFVYKHYPLTGIHPNAQRAAEASEAAGAQGKFWEFHDYLFQNQSESSDWTTEKLVQYASELGLDTERFKKELTEGAYRKAVRETRNEATSAGYTGTPTVVLNGQKFDNPTYEALEQEIIKILGIQPTPTPTVAPTATVEPTATPAPTTSSENQ